MHYSTEAEAGVLGSLITMGSIKKSNIDVIAELSPDAFAINNNRTVCEAILFLAKNNLSFDLINISEHIKQNKLSISEEPFAYCATLQSNTPSTANLFAYWEVVKDKHKIRVIQAKLNDTAEILEQAGNDKEKINSAMTSLSDVQTEEDKTMFRSTNELCVLFVEGLQARYERGGEIAGLSFGFDKIDELTCGAEVGDYIGICAKPSGGKTVSAMDIIIRAVTRGESALIFSLEMTSQSLMDRVYSNIAEVNLKNIRNADLDDLQHNKIGIATQDFKSKALTIVDKPSLHISDIENLSKAYKLKHGAPDWVMIDYWELIRNEGQNKVVQMEDTSKRLKALAKTIGTRIIVLAQLRKDAIGRPNATQIKWSAQLEQDVDVLIFIHTDNEEQKPHPEQFTEWILNKVRQGETGLMPTKSLMHFQKFEEFKGDYKTEEKEPSRFER